MAALPDARGATADPGIVSGLRRSAADEFFFRSALNQLDTHAARPVHEGDAISSLFQIDVERIEPMS